MNCFPRLTSSIYPWFGIRVFVLLDRLPTKANELHLPVFEVRVVTLLGYVGPRHLIPYHSGAAPLREASPIRHPGYAPLRRIAPARGVSWCIYHIIDSKDICGKFSSFVICRVPPCMFDIREQIPIVKTPSLTNFTIGK